jgi:D-beta-D-heptose 7-phosphate kinase/D-beta-D-heptose 1-phosphate adenosyltransferase
LNDRLLRLVETLGSPHILVVGELLLDRYIWGAVERISPEAPIPVLKVTSVEERLGGAGCVVNNLVTLGARVACSSVLGADANGRSLLQRLSDIQVDTSGIYTERGRETIVKSRMIGFVQSANRAAQHIMRMDEERHVPVSVETRKGLVADIRRRIGEFDAILVSDYDKGLIDRSVIEAVVSAPGGREIPVVVDPRRSEDYSMYRGVTALTPNRYEAAVASGVSCETLEGVEEAGRELLKRLGAKEVAVTIDKDGIFLCTSDGLCRHFGVQARNVYDVTGAGDMVLSAFGLARAVGADVEEAVALANVAAGLEVTKLGAAPVSKHELFEVISCDRSNAEGKLRGRSEIESIATAHRSAGETVVFTNGCFDILHPGHVRYLEFARRKGDVLIVGLNSDKSVRELKGEKRPVLDEKSRAMILGALEPVTHVVLFDEATPAKLIEQVRPDVLVKGEDWKDKGVVGREFVESYGGRVELAEMMEGYSTSEIIDRIREAREQ